MKLFSMPPLSSIWLSWHSQISEWWGVQMFKSFKKCTWILKKSKIHISIYNCENANCLSQRLSKGGNFYMTEGNTVIKMRCYIPRFQVRRLGFPLEKQTYRTTSQVLRVTISQLHWVNIIHRVHGHRKRWASDEWNQNNKMSGPGW